MSYVEFILGTVPIGMATSWLYRFKACFFNACKENDVLCLTKPELDSIVGN